MWEREKWLGEGRDHRPPAGRTCIPHARTRAARRGHTPCGARSQRKRGATLAVRLVATKNPVTLSSSDKGKSPSFGGHRLRSWPSQLLYCERRDWAAIRTASSRQRLQVPSTGRAAPLGLWERTGRLLAASSPGPLRPSHPSSPLPLLLPAFPHWETLSSHRWKNPPTGKGRVRISEAPLPSPFRGRCLLFSGFDFTFLKGQGPLQPVG